MMDVEKEVVYWRDGAVKDLQFADRLIVREEEEILYCFFFLHLTLEKVFKIEARYPNLSIPSPTLQKAKEYFEQTKELVEWLIKQL